MQLIKCELPPMETTTGKSSRRERSTFASCISPQTSACGDAS